MVQERFVTDVETLLPEKEFTDSSTDLKGIITEANPIFEQVSGYSLEEMKGNLQLPARPFGSSPNAPYPGAEAQFGGAAANRAARQLKLPWALSWCG
jgi:PAS domain-containing protein